MNFETAFREYLEKNDFAKKYSHRIWPLNIYFYGSKRDNR